MSTYPKEDGPFQPKTAEGDAKPESQWTPDERRVVVQDQRLKSIIMSCLPDDIMESVISCVSAKETWTDLVHSFEGPSDTKENRIMDLKLEYQTFRAKSTESLSQTYTRYKTLLNELANDGVNLSKHEINVGFVNSLPEKWLTFSQGLRNANHTQTLDLADIYGRFVYEDNLIQRRYSDTKKALITTPSSTPISTAFFSNNVIQDFQENSDDEVDERTSEEYLRDLDIEYHERALLANSKRFIKRRNNFSGQKANENTECYKCGNKGHFVRDCFSKMSEPSYKSPVNNYSSVSKGFQPKFTPKLIQSSSNSNNQADPKFQKDYKAEYKKMKSKLAADQDSLNSAAGGNLLERRTQDVLTIIENKSKVRNSRNKSIVSQVKSSDVNSSSSSEIAKLTHAVNQQTTACLTADGNTFPEFQDNIQGYVSAAAVNYNQGNSGYRPPTMQAQINNVKNELRNEMQTSIQASMSNQTNELKNMMASFFQMNTASTSGSGSLPGNTIANPKGELKAITTRSGLVLDGPSVPMPHPFINPEEDERAEETLTDPKLAEYTIKVPPPLVQKAKPTSLKNYVVHKRDPLHPNIPYPSRMHQEKQQEKDEVQIHKFWQMFKQLHINISLSDALILIPKYQKTPKSLLSNKEKLLELANTPLNENCSAVILKKLPEKLGDPGKFLIPCGFSELKCKALADLGASINLMPLSVWKKLGLPELISTRMTLELANRAICTPARIARDVFVPVGKFTFPADFVIVDYESDPRVPLILGRPFLRTARALIDVHGEEMILCDGDERLILNMRHTTSSYSNKTKKESINMIDIYNVSHKDYLEDLFANEKATNHQSGNPTFSSHTDLTSPEVINPLSGNPTPISEPVTKSSSSPIITSFEEIDLLLEEFADELALITFPPVNDDLPFDIKSDLKEIEYFLNNDTTKEMDSILEDSVDEGNLANPNNDLVDTIPEMFTDEHTLDYSSPPLYDDVDDDLVELKSDNDDVYDDPFDSKEDKIKESKLLIDKLDPLDQDKVFNPGIPTHENHFEVTNCAKNVKKTTNASLILEDFNPPLYELPFHKEVPGSETLLSFSSKNEEKVFNPGILTSKGVHTSLLPELSIGP
ncbi:reverse transcriptase domain-containing protein [Tanacetum coccineum]